MDLRPLVLVAASMATSLCFAQSGAGQPGECGAKAIPQPTEGKHLWVGKCNSGLLDGEGFLKHYDRADRLVWIYNAKFNNGEYVYTIYAYGNVNGRVVQG